MAHGINQITETGVDISSRVVSDTGVDFTILDDVNFKVKSALDNRTDTIQVPPSGTTPTLFSATSPSAL